MRSTGPVHGIALGSNDAQAISLLLAGLGTLRTKIHQVKHIFAAIFIGREEQNAMPDHG
jgi:hypothetical protein